MAAKYGVTVPQIMLNWGLCRGHVVIPRSESVPHLRDNMAVYSFKLTDNEVEEIKDLDQGLRLINKMPYFDNVDLFA